MKKIGQGWQYKVYDLGNSRVRKQKYIKFIQYLYILTHHRSIKGDTARFHKAYIEMNRVNRMECEANNYIKKISNILDKNILGNPVFISDSCYEQDRVGPQKKFYRL